MWWRRGVWSFALLGNVVLLALIVFFAASGTMEGSVSVESEGDQSTRSLSLLELLTAVSAVPLLSIIALLVSFPRTAKPNVASAFD